MHHVALERSGPDDRHLDDEIIKIAWFQPRQHRNLGARLNLEHANGVAAANHVIDPRVFRRHIRHGERSRHAGTTDGRLL